MPGCPTAFIAYYDLVLTSEVRNLLTTPAGVAIPFGRGLMRHEREVFRVDFHTEREAARRLLPEPLLLTDDACASVHFTQFHYIFGNESYIEVSLSIDASYEGKVGAYIVSVHTDNIPSLLLNRDLYVQPIVYGNPALDREHGVITGRLSVAGERVVTATGSFAAELMSEQDAIDIASQRKFFLKILGSPFLQQKPEAVLFELSPASLEIVEAFHGGARLRLDEHVLAPLADLPVRLVKGYSLIRAHYTPGTLKRIYEYGQGD